MKCLACYSEMKDFFVRKFDGDCGLGDVEYEKCPICGSVRSGYHASLSDQDFGELCRTAFDKYDRDKVGHRSHSRGIAEQCTTMIDTKGDTWLDYGSGDSEIAKLVCQRGHKVLCYDPYQGATFDVAAQEYQVMLAIDVVEHLRDREAIDHFLGAAKRADMLFLDTPLQHEWSAGQGGQFVPGHCLLLTPTGLQIMLYRAGFVQSARAEEKPLWTKF